MSRWVGESEGNIRQLFERARANRPSIVFIDEIDALAGRRGAVEVHDSDVNQLLVEIDGVAGQRGVFMIGATNRPDQIDPAMLRGGRLSRRPCSAFPTRRGGWRSCGCIRPTCPPLGVRLDELARQTDGMSPADLKSLCQEARGDGAEAAVTTDFTEALPRLRAGKHGTRTLVWSS